MIYCLKSAHSRLSHSKNCFSYGFQSIVKVGIDSLLSAEERVSAKVDHKSAFFELAFAR